LRCSAAERISLRQQYLTLRTYPEVPGALEALHRRHALLLLSHGTQHMLDTVAERAGISRYFEAIRSVDAVGAYKPDPRAYALAEESLRTDRADIGFVSTNPFDIAGAKAFGLRPIWLHRGIPDSRIMALLADGSVENLDELVSILPA
jgi:2-haloacid dehalogenase